MRALYFAALFCAPLPAASHAQSSMLSVPLSSLPSESEDLYEFETDKYLQNGVRQTTPLMSLSATQGLPFFKQVFKVRDFNRAPISADPPAPDTLPDPSSLSTDRFWTFGVTPAGVNTTRFNHRVFFGKEASLYDGSYAGNAPNWEWTTAGGIFAYLPRNAETITMHPYGSIGGLYAGHTENSGSLPEIANSACCNIPLAIHSLNDNTSIIQPSWGLYSTITRLPGTGSQVNEIDVMNADDVVHRATAYAPGAGSDWTIGWGLNAGGEAATGKEVYPQKSAATAAMFVGSNGSTWDKGIVFQSGAISPSESGHTVDIEMPSNHWLKWIADNTGAATAYVTSSVSTVAHAIGLTFSDSGALFQSPDGSQISLQIQSVPNSVNRLIVSPSVTGSPVAVTATGSDTNVDIDLVSKGSGVINIQGAMIVPFLTPTSSSASCRPNQVAADKDFLYSCIAANHWRRVKISDF
ncbi:hypothetical protein LGH83_11470 [Lichenihabitans sp. PAMC28606]|uniref:hypothetical protein n=1 Tax=Lichenihabitans sp. PAMC28606 TaxID=2880932 RepID=UPI001D0BA507|nr:hypothetical protein [Lichenihabitans sp. PAMC28606]UDL93226.1 hypothetical protein LGH83_11470 [Lichenihabitans sp. PAMC28606]